MSTAVPPLDSVPASSVRVFGVEGTSAGEPGVGVYGVSTNTLGGYGVYGAATGQFGYGVYGYNDTGGVGVAAEARGGGFAISAIGNSAFGGNIQVNPGNVEVSGTVDASVVCASNITCTSSRRFKTDIETLQGSLARVERLRGVSFDWKETGKHDLGLIAEEVRDVVPEVVFYEKDSDEVRGLDYARLTAVLIEAIKEQQAQSREKDGQIQDRSSS